MLPRIPTLIFACTLTAACGGQGATLTTRVTAPPPPATTAFPQAPAFNAADFRTAVADDTRAQALTETAPGDLRYGRATYDGHIQSGALVNGADGYGIIGDLQLSVDINTRQPIAGRNPVQGTITDLTLIDRFQGDLTEALAGRLAITGDATLGEVEATARGTLARDRLGSRVDDLADMAITLDGAFQNDFDRGDVVTGAVGGGTTGNSRNDFAITLVDEGRFYGTN